MANAEVHAYVHLTNAGELLRRLSRIEQMLAQIGRAVITEGELTVGALEDLQAVDAELAAAVTDLSGAVDRIDADFVKLEQAVASGNADAIEAEVANLRATVDAAKAAKANIDAADPAPVEQPPADGTAQE